jgi:hypothetical protein
MPMTNEAWTLAEISRAILSYNSDTAPESGQTIKNESGLGEKHAAAELPSAARTRRHDDQHAPGYWPIR